MSVTVIVTPTNPVVAKGAKLSFALSGGGNYVRVWCTEAPTGSQLRSKLDNNASSREEIFAGDALADSIPFQFQPDKPGRYELVAQEYQRGATGFGGGYAGDPLGFNSETKIDAESSLTIDFGSKVTMQLGVSPDVATLTMYVFGNNVEATTFELHGENTPAITDPKTPAARNAASTLQGNSAGLAGFSATALVGDINTIVNNMVSVFDGHFGDAVAHDGGDPYNLIPIAYKDPTTKKAIVKSVTELLTILGLHMNTDQARRTPFVSTGLGTGGWHDVGSGPVADGVHALIAPPPTDIAGAYLALADMNACYPLHAVSVSVHNSADITHVLAAAPPLLALHGAFLNILRATSPSPAPNENPGVPILVGGAGCKEA